MSLPLKELGILAIPRWGRNTSKHAHNTKSIVYALSSYCCIASHYQHGP